MNLALPSDSKDTQSPGASSPDTRAFGIAAWVWLSYLAALACVDGYIYSNLPNALIIEYYILLGVPALAFLSLAFSNWSKIHARASTLLLILLISLPPITLNHVVILPYAPLSNMEGMILRQLPVLFIGLVLVAWHFNLMTMIIFSLATTALELGMVRAVGQWDEPLLLNVYYVVIVRTISFIVVGIFINQLITRLRAQQDSMRSANAQLSQYASILERVALTDPLTGAFNRRYFFDHAKDIFARAKQPPYDLAVLMIDIDHFKKVNDHYGHTVGDSVLCEVVRRLTRNLRATDVLARYGGEEFTVLLPRTDRALACQIAERLLKAIAELPFPAVDASITVSIGVAILDEQIANLDVLVINADQAMYQAKRTGRNRWVLDWHKPFAERDTSAVISTAGEQAPVLPYSSSQITR